MRQTEKYCKKCNKVLPSNRSKYCNDECFKLSRNDYYQKVKDNPAFIARRKAWYVKNRETYKEKMKMAYRNSPKFKNFKWKGYHPSPETIAEVERIKKLENPTSKEYKEEMYRKVIERAKQENAEIIEGNEEEDFINADDIDAKAEDYYRTFKTAEEKRKMKKESGNDEENAE